MEKKSHKENPYKKKSDKKVKKAKESNNISKTSKYKGIPSIFGNQT